MKELELYIHIPFCVKKCAYCDFLSAPAGEMEQRKYVDALIKEIEFNQEEFSGYLVRTVFMGGGTPSILKEEETAQIFQALRGNFHVDEKAEITMEVNPGTVTKGKVFQWKESGVNRLSIGLQSVNDEELRMLGRIHTYEQFLDTWDLVRAGGFDNVNIDLISAIPGQTAENWERTLRAVADLGPEHLSAYSLIVEEGTPFYDRYGQNSENTGNWPPLPDEDTERRIYEDTARILKKYGYHRYEISNYAKEGYECRHNLGYWERKEYLGLGLGASSLIGDQRFHNTVDMEKYLKVCKDMEKGKKQLDRHTFLYEDMEELSEKDCTEEFMFLGLRKTAGVSCSEFGKLFGKNVEEVYGGLIRRFTGQGLLERDGDMLRLTERGIDVSNYVFSEFLS